MPTEAVYHCEQLDMATRGEGLEELVWQGIWATLMFQVDGWSDTEIKKLRTGEGNG